MDWIQPTAPGEPFETDPAKRRAIIDTILQAAGKTHEDLAGTAVQGLHLILLGRDRSERQNEPSARYPLPFTVQELRPLAVKLATASEATDAARMTALQVCAQRGFDEVLPLARTIAANPKRRETLRLSAIAAVGRLGTAEDQALLKELSQTASPYLQKAAQPALRTLNQRAANPQPSPAQPVSAVAF